MSEESLETIFKSVPFLTIQAERDDVRSLSKLLEWGRTKGFQNFLNRKTIWPFLLKVDLGSMSGGVFEWDGEMDRNSSDYEQLQKDAERSLSSMKTF